MESITLLKAGLIIITQLLSGIGKPFTFLLIWSLEFSLNLATRLSNYIQFKAWRFRLFYKRTSVAWRRRFEHQFARQSLGLLLVPFAFIIFTFSPELIKAENSTLDLNSLTLSTEANLLLKTTESVRLPIRPLILTQGYIPGHPALDIKGQKGDPIYPVMKGKVKVSIHSRTGYGNYVIIDHGKGLESLYAHMNKIIAKNGDEVTTEVAIGEVGSTGRSTGNHLHLEIIDQGRKVNPLSIIGGVK
jgi:murein DD-endopeptidase MepM/ murein hydrolase activator NlpD